MPGSMCLLFSFSLGSPTCSVSACCASVLNPLSLTLGLAMGAGNWVGGSLMDLLQFLCICFSLLCPHWGKDVLIIQCDFALCLQSHSKPNCVHGKENAVVWLCSQPNQQELGMQILVLMRSPYHHSPQWPPCISVHSFSLKSHSWLLLYLLKVVSGIFLWLKLFGAFGLSSLPPCPWSYTHLHVHLLLCQILFLKNNLEQFLEKDDHCFF